MGIVVLAMILNSVGIPTSGIALIIGVDRILDMSRTAVNVAGDLVTCKVMDRWVGKEVVKAQVGEIAEVKVEKAPEEKIEEKVQTTMDITTSESSKA